MQSMGGQNYGQPRPMQSMAGQNYGQPPPRQSSQPGGGKGGQMPGQQSGLQSGQLSGTMGPGQMSGQPPAMSAPNLTGEATLAQPAMATLQPGQMQQGQQGQMSGQPQQSPMAMLDRRPRPGMNRLAMDNFGPKSGPMNRLAMDNWGQNTASTMPHRGFGPFSGYADDTLSILLRGGSGSLFRRF